MADTYSGPPQWYQDYARGYLGNAATLAQRPYQAYQGQRVADMSPTTMAGIQGISGMMNSPLMGAAGNQVMNTLQDGGWNPFTQNVADRVTSDVTRNFYGANNALLGRFRGANRNSSAFDQQQGLLQENFARGLGDALAPIYSQGFENAAGRQNQAVGQAAGLLGAQSNLYQNGINAGNLQQQQQQNLLNSQYNDWMNYWNYPQQQLDSYGNALRATMGGAGTQTQTPGADRTSQALGLFSMMGMPWGSNGQSLGSSLWNGFTGLF